MSLFRHNSIAICENLCIIKVDEEPIDGASKILVIRITASLVAGRLFLFVHVYSQSNNSCYSRYHPENYTCKLTQVRKRYVIHNTPSCLYTICILHEGKHKRILLPF